MLPVISSAVLPIKAKGQKYTLKIKSFSFNFSRLYDHATMIRHAVLKTMNETRVSLLSLQGLFPHLPLCHEAHWSMFWDWGLENLVAVLARILGGITIHSRKAALCPFNVTKLKWSGMSFTLCGIGINYSPRVHFKTWSAYHPRQPGSWFAEICTWKHFVYRHLRKI